MVALTRSLVGSEGRDWGRDWVWDCVLLLFLALESGTLGLPSTNVSSACIARRHANRRLVALALTLACLFLWSGVGWGEGEGEG